MNTTAHHTLEDLLDRELEIAQRLAAALATERTALTGDSPDAVQAVALEKERLFAALERLESERRAAWVTPPHDRAGAPAGITERWRALLQIMAGCRTANAVNGHIIHVRQSQIRQLLDIVRGGPAHTYGPRGNTDARSLRALATA